MQHREGLVKEIDLSYQNLTEVPSWIFQHARTVKKLFLSENQLTSLPKEIGSLKRLEVLSLRGNRLTSLPKEIGLLTHMEFLFLRGNYLITLPKEINSLTRLRHLDLRENLLTSLPSNIEKVFNKEQVLKEQVLKEIEQNKEWKENKRKMFEELLSYRKPTEWITDYRFVMTQLEMMPQGTIEGIPHFKGNHFERGMELFDEITTN